MSVCSTAVGLLATVATVHIVISIILAVLVGFVLYVDRRSKDLRRGKLKTSTEVLAGAGRTLGPAKQQSEPEEVGARHLESTSEIVAQNDIVVEDYDDIVSGENIKNPWAETSSKDSDSNDVLHKELLDKAVPLRRRASPMVRTVSPLVRTGSPLVRTGSPLVRTDSPGAKGRLSIISIASNLSSKFRRSVDLSEEEAKLVLSMSPSVVIDDAEFNGEEGILGLSGDYKLDESIAENDVINQVGNENDLSSEPKIDLSWQASESSC